MRKKEFRDVKLKLVDERNYQGWDEHFLALSPLPPTLTFRVEGVREFPDALHSVNEAKGMEQHCFGQDKMIERQIPPFPKNTYYFLELHNNF